MNELDKKIIADWFRGLQDHICQELEILDGKSTFEEELWERPGGGGGRTRIIQNGQLIEKGGVNFSAVYGSAPSPLVKKGVLPEGEFFATGVSIVLHPFNPWVPIIHMNVRYFEASNGQYWFGGGIDATPHYIDKKDAAAFHSMLKACCDKHNKDYYVKFKDWADNYFFIPHRQETRGIGGIFFDRLTEDEQMSKVALWEFVKEVGHTFVPAYKLLVSSKRQLPFGERQKEWQLIRRSRYAEFNLVYDAGTKFGLETQGRIESILMSMPPLAAWKYNYQPEPGSLEADTQALLKKGIDWLSLE
ncbi:coproporphyrinogen III oxidase [Thermonema lapsum]|uniref:coproporphyrinogen oxidase n=1 Tax=Thermonema lapsum TaxID=28195 RepID=A0A846MMW0_9BACT|nr:oxygen-dependent coproporphyrinogen oxidase [Thermonema lapsum]NIK72888.1 coproporphyrinogen III oxidase [Thermonema lapsum]